MTMDTNESFPKAENLKFPKYPKLASTDEANLLWDEYKYRHDLIWRHLIRSTLALVVLVTVPYSTAFNFTFWLVVLAWLAALGYWLMTLVVVEAELRLYIKVKSLHRQRQTHYFGLHEEPIQIAESLQWGQIFLIDSFSRRVGVFLLLLLVATLIVGPIVLLGI